VTKTTTRVLAGVAVAVLAAAGVAAVVRFQQGQNRGPDEDQKLDELAVRLDEVAAWDTSTPPNGLGRILEVLQRKQGISAARLLRWITGVRQGTVSFEQAVVAESDFAALEREADQGGV
jgi:hypothetical protein